MRHYQCLPIDPVNYGKFSLLTVQDEHIQLIRQWRNDQMKVLRQSSPISEAQQIQYFDNVIWPTLEQAEPANILLTFLEDGKAIGYGGLVHIAWEHRRAEVSFLLEPTRAKSISVRKKYFSSYLKLLKDLAFSHFQLNRLTTETYDIRPDYIEVLEANGFKPEGRMCEHVLIDGTYVDSLMHGLLCMNPDEKKLVSSVSSKGVLVSSASRKVPLIRSLIKAARHIDSTIKIYAGDINCKAHSQYVSDGFVQLPAIEPTNIGTIIKICRELNISVIIPTRDGELLFWAENLERFRKEGIDIVISEAAAVSMSVDKLVFALFGLDNNLPVIPAWESPQGKGSFVVKERFGAGSRSIGLNLSREQAIEHGKTLNQPIFQPYIVGKEISVDAWVSREHKVKGLVLRVRNEVVNGESVVTTTFRDHYLEEECRKVLEALPLRGPVVLQLIVDEAGHPHIIELNARFGGASTTSIAAGLDIWYWTLLEANGEDLKNYPFNRCEQEVRQVRVSQDLVIYGSDL